MDQFCEDQGICKRCVVKDAMGITYERKILALLQENIPALISSNASKTNHSIDNLSEDIIAMTDKVSGLSNALYQATGAIKDLGHQIADIQM